MKTLIRAALLALICVVAWGGSARAVGLGGYLEFGGGSGEFEYPDTNLGEFDVDAGYFGLGFVFDTNPGEEGIFAYRLNAGFEGLNLEDDSNDTLELGGLVFDNTFGFALVRTPVVKLWVGPQLRLAFYSGETDNSDNDPAHTDADLAAFGIGVAMGANIYPNPNGRFAICPTLGYRRVSYAGTAEFPDGTDEDLEGYTDVLFLNVSFLFGR